MLKEIAFTCYPVADMAKARAFYEGLLGLKVTHSFGDGWIEYDLGAGTFVVTSMDENHKPGIKGAVVAFEVEDFDKAMSHLKERHAKFINEPSDTPVCRVAVIADPDGNEIILHKRKG
jgi:predicted enzyme related to lactoylglutathione lyase